MLRTTISRRALAIACLLWLAGPVFAQGLPSGQGPMIPVYGGPVALNEFAETTSFTPAASGIYYINASGLTLTVPSSSVGGDILIVDKTGAPNLTISGTILNAPGITSITAAYATFTLRWSAKYLGFVLI